jgi:hypothetical protein
MDRSAAKAKVALLLSNYARPPRGKKLAAGTADRLTDRLLADEFAAADLAELDPNDDFSAASFVRRNLEAFRGAANPPKRRKPVETLAAETNRAVNRAIDAARDRYVDAVLGGPRVVGDGAVRPKPTRAATDAKLADAILDFVVAGDGAEAISYVLRGLREDGWRNLPGNLSDFEALVERLGFSVREGRNSRNQRRREIVVE